MNNYVIDNFINAELLEEAVYKNRCIWVKVKGKSMFPVFTDGSLVQVSLCVFEDISIGDIAVFKNPENVICHRVLRKINIGGKRFLKTKPDTSFAFDPLVKQEELIGKINVLKKRNFNIKIDNLTCRSIGLFFSCMLPFASHLKNGLSNKN